MGNNSVSTIVIKSFSIQPIALSLIYSSRWVFLPLIFLTHNELAWNVWAGVNHILIIQYEEGKKTKRKAKTKRVCRSRTALSVIFRLHIPFARGFDLSFFRIVDFSPSSPCHRDRIENIEFHSMRISFDANVYPCWWCDSKSLLGRLYCTDDKRWNACKRQFKMTISLTTTFHFSYCFFSSSIDSVMHHSHSNNNNSPSSSWISINICMAQHC